jgi:hypothetical protein
MENPLLIEAWRLLVDLTASAAGFGVQKLQARFHTGFLF